MFFERLSYKVGPLLVCSDLDLGRVPTILDKSATAPILYKQHGLL